MVLINILAVFILNAILIGGYIFQFVEGDLPCPLCLLVRMCMLGAAFGFLLNIFYGIRPVHYGITLLASLLGAAVATRQILLHIVPGTGEYGSPFLTLHLYTWALITFLAVILLVAFLLVFYYKNEKREDSLQWAKLGKKAFLLTIAVALSNVVMTYLECGNEKCPDDPVEYKVISDWMKNE